MPVLHPADWTAEPPTRRGRSPTPPSSSAAERPAKRRRGSTSEPKRDPTPEQEPDADVVSVASSETRSASAEVDVMQTDDTLKDYAARMREQSRKVPPLQSTTTALDALVAVASVQESIDLTALESVMRRARTRKSASAAPQPAPRPFPSQSTSAEPSDLADAWVQKRLRQRFRGRDLDSKHPPPMQRPPKELELQMDREKAMREKEKILTLDNSKIKEKEIEKEKEEEQEEFSSNSPDEQVMIHRHIAERRAYRDFGREQNHRFYCTFIVDKRTMQECDYYLQGYTTWSDLARHCDAKHASVEIEQIRKGTLTFNEAQWVKSQAQMDALKDTIKMRCEKCGTVFPSGRADSLNRHRTNGACEKAQQKRKQVIHNIKKAADYEDDRSEPESETN
ncbi:hypothetical protein M422DRAFT_23112 [Sphaerobolus stellatus SS14]|nr:hypothetical protein M422DRAFT_23112 [Sphaerobolus stellatus SS14]